MFAVVVVTFCGTLHLFPQQSCARILVLDLSNRLVGFSEDGPQMFKQKHARLPLNIGIPFKDQLLVCFLC